LILYNDHYLILRDEYIDVPYNFTQ